MQAEEIRGRVLDEVLAIVRSRRGIDFRGYRRATIERRLLNRIVSARAASPAETCTACGRARTRPTA